MAMARSYFLYAAIATMTMIAPMCSSTYTIDVTTLGAKPDGKTDSSAALKAAWTKACASESEATIVVPPGRFFLTNAEFSGTCKSSNVAFLIAGTFIAPSQNSASKWITFSHVDGVTISGGLFDGQGSSLWSCKRSGKSCSSGATSLEISNSRNIKVQGVTSVNSQMFHIVINGCENVKLQGVKVSAPKESPNTDGIHVQASTNVEIVDAKIGTGDDCVSIGPGTRGLSIDGIACGPGHGVSIGSLGKDEAEAGVENVTVSAATFSGTQNGLRIKSWGRPSSGFARDIVFQHVTMSDVQNPIVIDQNYCPGEKGCPGEASGVRISGVTYLDVHGTSATEVAVRFDCSSKQPCSGIKLEDVKLSYENKAALSSCSHAVGTSSGVVQPSSCL